ncbi:MAG: IS66 family insertion sequence element accessory protein TnpB [Acetobacteraceae bacterium]
MMQLTAQMRILVAVEAIDFRAGIDTLARLCQARLNSDPFDGGLFVFRNRRNTAIKALCYDGQGFWLFHKRLSSHRFPYWPKSASQAASLQAHELQVLLMAGDPGATKAAPAWRRLPAAPAPERYCPAPV